jgi:hypothetical protein
MNHAYDVVLAACGGRHGNALEVGRAAVHWQVARNAESSYQNTQRPLCEHAISGEEAGGQGAAKSTADLAAHD